MGTSNAKTRHEASSAVPYRLLRSEQARRVHEIVSHPSIYRRLPVKTIDCDHEMFTFLVRNPEVVVGIWQNMGVTKLSITRRGAHSFEASDGMGTTSQFQLLYGAPRLHIYHGTGFYEGPLLKKKLRGECVLLVRTAYRRTPQGRMSITNVLDVFVHVENAAVDLAAKTLYPLFIHAADENLVTTVNFLSQLSYTAEMNPQKVTQLAGRLRQVTPEVRQDFSTVAQTVSQRRIALPSRAAADATANSSAANTYSESVGQVQYQRTMKTEPRRSTTPPPAAIISRYPPDYPRYR